MFSYIAYGLALRSALPLPELVAADGTTDVFVRLGKVDRSRSKAAAEGHCFRAFADEAYLFWKEVGTFLVRSGNEIIVEPAPGVEERVLRLFILGTALAVMLHQRGLLVLHASAVALDDGAVVFLGGPGWGKSTMAAAMYARDYGVVADDVVAVDLDGENWKITPQFCNVVGRHVLAQLCARVDVRQGVDLRQGYSFGMSLNVASMLTTISPSTVVWPRILPTQFRNQSSSVVEMS